MIANTADAPSKTPGSGKSPPTRSPGIRGPLRGDPRLYQLFCQVAILCYGLKYLEFARFLPNVPVVLAACLLTQLIAISVLRNRRSNPVRLAFDWRSPAISALSLALLLRSNELWIAAAAGALTIGSKFLIRARGKHLFNPSLFGIVAVLALFPEDAWVSPGQWGREGLLLFFVACAGGFVLFRALRSDITLAFLGSYAALVVARALWLGDPWPIVANQLSSGSLLIFAFFMISDPKSTPDARIGRVIFAALTALVAFAIQFGLYDSNGLLWSLFLCAFSVPLIDRFAFNSDRRRDSARAGHGEAQPSKFAGRFDEAVESPSGAGPIGSPAGANERVRTAHEHPAQREPRPAAVALTGAET